MRACVTPHSSSPRKTATKGPQIAKGGVASCCAKGSEQVSQKRCGKNGTAGLIPAHAKVQIRRIQSTSTTQPAFQAGSLHSKASVKCSGSETRRYTRISKFGKAYEKASKSNARREAETHFSRTCETNPKFAIRTVMSVVSSLAEGEIGRHQSENMR